MFRSKARELSAHEDHLTGLERARLERLIPQPAATSTQPIAEAPVQPVMVVKPAQATQQAPVMRPAAVAPTPPKSAPAGAPLTNQSQMIVGPGVVLKGNVLNCEVLRVEGTVEGDVKARKISVSADGALLGTAEVEEAEIEGRFEGTLAVTGLLLVQATGRMSGKFSYGALEIKRGGEMAGEMEVGSKPRPRAMEVVRQSDALRVSDPAAKVLKTA